MQNCERDGGMKTNVLLWKCGLLRLLMLKVKFEEIVGKNE